MKIADKIIKKDNYIEMKQDDEIEADYFGLTAAWDEELYGKLKTDRKIAFIVAGISICIAAMALGAVMMLTPLKTVEPYVVFVDKTTGYAESTRKLTYDENNPLTGHEAVVLGEINQYIIARHTFDPHDLKARFLSIQLSTDGTEFARYVKEVENDNDQLSMTVRRTVTVKSIVPNMTNKSATVRFSTSLDVRNQIVTEHWVATLTYDFLELPIELKRKYLNPLGFIVQSYRVDQENVN